MKHEICDVGAYFICIICIYSSTVSRETVKVEAEDGRVQKDGEPETKSHHTSTLSSLWNNLQDEEQKRPRTAHPVQSHESFQTFL
jgi:hypothetical protein